MRNWNAHRRQREGGHGGGRDGANANVAGDSRRGDVRDARLGEDGEVAGSAQIHSARIGMERPPRVGRRRDNDGQEVDHFGGYRPIAEC